MREICEVTARDIITTEEIEQLRPYMPNIEEFLDKPFFCDFTAEMGYAITDYLDEDDELTPISRMLERKLDELIYRANEKKE